MFKPENLPNMNKTWKLFAWLMNQTKLFSLIQVYAIFLFFITSIFFATLLAQIKLSLYKKDYMGYFHSLYPLKVQFGKEDEN